MTGCPPAPLQGTTYFPLSVNLQWELPLLLRMSRCPGSRKSQLEGSQKSITLHFSDSPFVLEISTQWSQYSPVFMPHTPLRATKHSVDDLALWFHFSQAQTSSLKQVENPFVFLGAEAGLQAMVASPILVWGTANSKPKAEAPMRPKIAALNISNQLYVDLKLYLESVKDWIVYFRIEFNQHVTCYKFDNKFG